MSSAVVDPLADTNLGVMRRSTTDRATPTFKKDNEPGPGGGKDNLLRRAVTANAIRSPTNSVRKRLPWLDKSEAKTDSKQSDQEGLQSPISSAASENLRAPDYHPETGNPYKPSVPVFLPSESKLSTNLRQPPLPSPLLQDRGKNAHTRELPTAAYASSDYSEHSSSAEEPMPPTLPRKDPASYERLVMHPPLTVAENAASYQRDQGISRRRSRVPESLKTEEPKHRGTRKPKPKPELERNFTESSFATGHRRRCKSCDESLKPDRRNQQSASPSIPRRSTRRRSDADVRRHNSSLTRTVTGLENLMEETLRVTREAARSGRGQDIASVLDEATLALREAGAVRSGMGRPLRSPPRTSPHSSQSGKGDVSSNSSSVSRARVSSETLPTIITHGGQFKRRLRRVKRQRSDHESSSRTPPRLYPAPSADSIVRDFAYTTAKRGRRHSDSAAGNYGAAACFYGDQGQSVAVQPGVRKSIAGYDKLVTVPPPAHVKNTHRLLGKHGRVFRAHLLQNGSEDRGLPAEDVDPLQPTNPPSQSAVSTTPQSPGQASPAQNPFSDSAAITADREADDDDTSSESSKPQTLKTHFSLKEGETFKANRYHKHRPIAREWTMGRKRLTAMIACLNTIFTGFIAGIYAGEVPRIQYQLADQSHWVIFGNTLLFAGMGLTTLIFWPLPLLHGRRPYVLVAFALMLPFHIPQAITVSASRNPGVLYRVGLLLPRALTGLALGFANINFLPTLWDLFGASLMSDRPHQEFVMYDDVRRQGGGVGVWLGLWTFCFSSSLSIGFCVGACIISKLDPSWGFWIVIMLLAFFLLVNVIAPETRKGAYRHSVHHFVDESDPSKVKRRVAKGEVKLHISNDGPAWWGEEVWAGLILTKRMVFQAGFFTMMTYLAWINAQLTLVILLLGALLSRDYKWQPQWVGLAALAVPIGAALALPLAKASWFSRARTSPPRTDSMTMRAHITWTSHFLRRLVFSLLLPFAGLGYCLTATGPPLHWSACVIFAGLVGFLTDLGITECIGLIMESFDTSDLQPGINTKHRAQSMSDTNKRRRTNYSSFPRVCAGFFAAQSLGFFLAAAATVVSGRVTNAHGAQFAMAIVAGILLGATLLFFVAVIRWKHVQVIPTWTRRGEWTSASDDPEWKPVIIGNPSGKMRRMNILEMGKWSRWSEIRRLNMLSRN